MRLSTFCLAVVVVVPAASAALAGPGFAPVRLVAAPEGISSGELRVPPGMQGIEITMTSADLWQGRVEALNRVGCDQMSEGSSYVRTRDIAIRPDEPVLIQLTAQPGAVCRVVAYPNGHVHRPRELEGAPSADAPLRERALQLHGAWAMATWGRGEPTLMWVKDAADAFATVKDTFFVYAKKAVDSEGLSSSHTHSRSLLAGEPLLVIDFQENTNASPVFLRANGMTVQLKLSGAERVSDFVQTARPATVVIPPPHSELRHPSSPMSKWKDDEFFPLASENDRIARFIEAKKKVAACVNKMFAKLDPDGRAGSYDLVTYDKNGKAKVEGYAQTLWRKVDAGCKTKKLWKEADAIRAELKKDAGKTQVEALVPVQARFAGGG